MAMKKQQQCHSPVKESLNGKSQDRHGDLLTKQIDNKRKNSLPVQNIGQAKKNGKPRKKYISLSP